LHEEIDESEDGIDSQTEAHGEEDHGPEVLSWEQSKKGGEHHKEELWSRFGEIKHWDSLVLGYMTQEGEDGQRGVERGKTVDGWDHV
jgi:hypothetical protein